MDKYEFNIKVEQLRKLVNKGDYETALKIVDTIDWKKVRNANLLSMVAQVYEKNEEYQDAKDVLLLAFERAPIGKRLLFKLTDLAVKEGNTEEAEAYYREFCDLAVDDPRQHLLRYMILKQKGAPAEQLIHSLEGYTAEELDEKWLYELAVLYHEAGDEAACVATCDKIMLMFGLGKYVDKAMELKLQYAPLTKYQMDLVENREKYEAKLRAVEQSFNDVADRDEDEAAAVSRVHVQRETPEEPDVSVSRMRSGEPDFPVSEVMPGELDIPGSQMMYGESDIPISQVMPGEPDIPVSQVMPGEPGVPVGQVMPAEAVREADMWREPLSETEDMRQEPFQNTTADIRPELFTTAVAEPSPHMEYDEAEAIAAAVKQAEVEEHLAKEMSKLSVEEFVQDEDEAGKTRVLGDLKRAQILSQETTILPDINKMAAAEAEEPEEEVELPKVANHLMIEAKTPEKGLEMATEALRQIQAETGIKNPVAKISGSKLNKRGILACAAKLKGKDLMVEEAGDLSPEMLKELEILMAQDTSGMRVILIDNPKQMEMLHAKNVSLASKFECIGSGDAPDASAFTAHAAPVLPEADDRPVRHVTPVRDTAMRVEAPEDYGYEEDEQEYEDDEEMDIDEFAQYACKYASEIDCSITGKSMLALYERIEIMEEDGVLLTRANAEELIEEAADRAEKPSLGKLITGVFSSKYDKDGLLILKEEHFI